MSGGQAIDFMAQGGDPSVYQFPHSMTQYRDCNFSFSGYSSFSFATIKVAEELFGNYYL